MKHLMLLIIIVLAVSVVYANVTGAHFCSYDDFINLHQTVFNDAHQPALMLTTSHFDSYKYRPLQRLINLFTNLLADGDPTFFRVRNLAFHLLNTMLVYALGWQLFRSTRVSGAAAILFGLHPLANQSVIGAIWTNTVAHTGFLLALVLFVASTRGKRFSNLWLTGALTSASLSLFTYDPEIVVFGLMLVYLLLFVVWPRQSIGFPYLLSFTTLSSIVVGAYIVMRRLFVPGGWEQAATGVSSPAIVGKNVVMYFTALLNPVDLVLTNEWFDTPLPSEISVNNSDLLVVAVLSLAIVFGVGVHLRRRLLNGILLDGQNIDWVTTYFLAVAIVAPLLPVLAFSSHPSETYLYLPVAFFMLLLAYLLATLFDSLRKPSVFYITVVVVVTGLSVSTWVRNQRVIACGQTARRILYSLPDKLLTSGSWTLAFANIPGEKATRRYGFYGFHGVDTIGHGSQADHAITHALQLVYDNILLNAKIVDAQALLDFCQESRSTHIGILVHWDGRIETQCRGSAGATYH